MKRTVGSWHLHFWCSSFWYTIGQFRTTTFCTVLNCFSIGVFSILKQTQTNAEKDFLVTRERSTLETFGSCFLLMSSLSPSIFVFLWAPAFFSFCYTCPEMRICPFLINNGSWESSRIGKLVKWKTDSDAHLCTQHISSDLSKRHHISRKTNTNETPM